MIDFDPSAIGGIVGGLIPAALIGATWVARTIIKNRKAAARMLVAGLDPDQAERDNNGEETTLKAAILEFIKQQQAERQADRQNTERQWQRLEDLAVQTRENAQAAWAINQTLQNFATWIDRSHQQQNELIARVEKNQSHLSDYLRDRMGGTVSWPSHHVRPPQQSA